MIDKPAEPKKHLGITTRMPGQHILIIKLGKKQLQKLAKWTKKGADINPLIHESGSNLYLFNETALEKWRRKEIRKGHVVEIREK